MRCAGKGAHVQPNLRAQKPVILWYAWQWLASCLLPQPGIAQGLHCQVERACCDTSLHDCPHPRIGLAGAALWPRCGHSAYTSCICYTSGLRREGREDATATARPPSGPPSVSPCGFAHPRSALVLTVSTVSAFLAHVYRTAHVGSQSITYTHMGGSTLSTKQHRAGPSKRIRVKEHIEPPKEEQGITFAYSTSWHKAN